MIEIRVAKSEEDLKAVYELRHLVYVKQDGKFGGINFPNKMENYEILDTLSSLMVLNT